MSTASETEFTPSKPGGRRAAAFVFLTAVVAAAGCGDGGAEAARQAVELLQKNRPQEAIDALAEETSPRACWLKSIALERLQHGDDARAQIEKAVSAEPKNVEYKGLALRLNLYEAKMEAADEIIALRDANRTSAALALFAFYAHAAKAVHHKALKREEEGRTEGGKAMLALNTAIALSADIPEFHRELLSLALKAQLAQGVDVLSEKLARMAPDDPEIQEERIAVQAMTGQFDDAVETATRLYDLRGRDEATALVLADLLRRSSPSQEHDLKFRDLVTAYPKNVVMLTRFGVYLARTKRTEMAMQAFDAALTEEKEPLQRLTLIDAMMSIVLETNAPALAEAQLARYRADIRDPLVQTYFEGRILFLKRDHRGALAKLGTVIDAQKGAVNTNRALAADALLWTQFILKDREAAEALKGAAEILRKAAGDSTPADEPAIAEVPEPAPR